MSAEPGFGSWLKQRRKELGLTQKELAKGVGCSPVTIEKIEAGERRPSRQIADLLAEFLGVPAEERPLFARFATGMVGREGSDASYNTGTGPAPWLALYHGRANLPAPATAFIGREAQVEEIKALLENPNVRLLTLIGPPGVGKTRLGLRVAASLVDRFADGVFFIPLANVNERDLILPAVAQTLGVKESGSAPLLGELKQYLRTKQLLLVMDNFEQLVPMAPLVADLLLSVPLLKVLVTSREVLHIYGEHEFDVPPLSLPDIDHLPPLEALSRYEAVRLFIERTGQTAASRNFALTGENASSVVEICTRLDGLPLAIELAAARIKDLGSPQAILSRLQNKLDLLAGGPQDLPPRQQTLRNAISWSYELLSEEEQRLFRSLGVFAARFSRDAVDEVLTSSDADEAPSAHLQSLLDKNLLQQETDTTGALRYYMLETIREYALEQLAQNGEAEGLRKRHALVYLTFTEEAASQLTGVEYETWLKRLDADYPNIRAAISSSIEAADAETALRFGSVLWRYWDIRGYLSEGRRWLELILKLDSSEYPLLRSNVLSSAGILAWSARDLDASRSMHEQSLLLRRQLGDKQRTASTLNNMGLVAQDQGDYEGALNLFQESLEICRELDDKADIASTLNNLGIVALAQGDINSARAMQQESIDLWEEEGDMYGVALALNNLAEVERASGDYAKAIPLYETSIQKMREMGDQSSVANALNNLGHIMHYQGKYQRALELFKESLTLRHRLDDIQGVSMSLAGLGGVLASCRQPEKAARLFGAAEAAFSRSTFQMQPVDRKDYENDVERARAQLDQGKFAQEWSKGRVLPVEKAVAYALETSVQD